MSGRAGVFRLCDRVNGSCRLVHASVRTRWLWYRADTRFPPHRGTIVSSDVLLLAESISAGGRGGGACVPVTGGR